MTIETYLFLLVLSAVALSAVLVLKWRRTKPEPVIFAPEAEKCSAILQTTLRDLKAEKRRAGI
jgi:hypothetical protein